MSAGCWATNGDGNCAFNAFAIGLWQAVRSQRITTLPQSFLAALQQQVKQIPRGGGAITFEDVAHWLQQCDSQSAQSALHGVLRFVAIQYFRARELDAVYCAALDVAFNSPQADDAVLRMTLSCRNRASIAMSAEVVPGECENSGTRSAESVSSIAHVRTKSALTKGKGARSRSAKRPLVGEATRWKGSERKGSRCKREEKENRIEGK
jgi:hypothetical protein